MPAPYNLTAINASNSTLGTMVAINNLADKQLATGLGIAMFVIAIGIGMATTRDLGKSLAAAGFGMFIIHIFLLAAGFVQWYVVIVYLVAFIIGIVMTAKKDYST
jgi:NADH:ubiquinone oxidoreductase subunit 6 (subunit J)